MFSKVQDKTDWKFALSFVLVLLTPPLHFGAPDCVSQAHLLPVSGIRTVVIDAGHGGKDPGCLGRHVKEKDIALAISLALGEQISATFPDIEVIYTREEDVFIPLHERARIANKARADLFISIHCNYVGKRNKAMGTETYVMGLHRAKDNLLVAKRENATILMEDDYVENYDGYDPESDEGHIILSMYQNAFLEQSITLADLVEKQFSHGVKRQSRGVKQAGFLVLRNTTMPSVLIETGFLSHDHEESFLSEPANQKKMAEGIFNAFAEYKRMVDAAAPILPHEDIAGSGADGEARYFVQLMASKNRLDTREGRWKSCARLEIRREDDYYKYLAGPFVNIDRARAEQDHLETAGFRGTFIVAYQNDKRVPVSEVIAGARR